MTKRASRLAFIWQYFCSDYLQKVNGKRYVLMNRTALKNAALATGYSATCAQVLSIFDKMPKQEFQLVELNKLTDWEVERLDYIARVRKERCYDLYITVRGAHGVGFKQRVREITKTYITGASLEVPGSTNRYSRTTGKLISRYDPDGEFGITEASFKKLNETLRRR